MKKVKRSVKKEEVFSRGKEKRGKCCSSSNCGGCAYFLGFLGAAIYYISVATSFWGGVFGVLKALVWPAFLVFEALKFFVA